MHDKKFQDELGKIKGDDVPIKNTPHKAFLESLKKQVSLDDPPISGGVESRNDNVENEELMKEIEAKFDELFANLDDDD